MEAIIEIDEIETAREAGETVRELVSDGILNVFNDEDVLKMRGILKMCVKKRILERIDDLSERIVVAMERKTLDDLFKSNPVIRNFAYSFFGFEQEGKK